MFFGVKGKAPGSWNTMVTMSLPMCLFLNNWQREEKRLRYQVKHKEVKYIVQEGTDFDFQVEDKRT